MTLFTLDCRLSKKRTEKISFLYLLISLFCALFGMIYENFSHEVYSGFMIYAFLFPLAGGTLPFWIISLYYKKPLKRLPINLYNSGIATLTIGSIMTGILEIFGTTNDIVQIYWFVGVGFIIAAIVIYAIDIHKIRNQNYF